MRSSSRRHRAALLAPAARLAAVLLLLAVDARAGTRPSRGTISASARFRPTRGLWQPPTSLPGDPRALLGTGDTIAYRRAMQLFWFSRIGSNPEVRQDLPTLRASRSTGSRPDARGAERDAALGPPRTCSASSS